MTGSPNATGREPQLAYSEIQGKMHDEHARRQKARKIIRVLHHYLGRDDLNGLSALDIGCSTGIIASELAADGATATGVDIDVPLNVAYPPPAVVERMFTPGAARWTDAWP